MLYLRDSMAKEGFQCRLFNKIKRMVEQYANRHEDRFTEIPKSTRCGLFMQLEVNFIAHGRNQEKSEGTKHGTANFQTEN